MKRRRKEEEEEVEEEEEEEKNLGSVLVSEAGGWQVQGQPRQFSKTLPENVKSEKQKRAGNMTVIISKKIFLSEKKNQQYTSFESYMPNYKIVHKGTMPIDINFVHKASSFVRPPDYPTTYFCN